MLSMQPKVCFFLLESREKYSNKKGEETNQSGKTSQLFIYKIKPNQEK